MKLFATVLGMPLLVFGLLACASPNPGQPTIDKEDKLLAAGFKKRPIKTEAQLADFRAIPAHMIRPSSFKGKPVYVYADPTICGCLYMGGRTAYNTYISGAMARSMQQGAEPENGSGYFPSAYMMDGGPWDDLDSYLYYND